MSSLKPPSRKTPARVLRALSSIVEFEKGASSDFNQRMHVYGLMEPALQQVRMAVGDENFAVMAEKTPQGWNIKQPKQLAKAYTLWLDDWFKQQLVGYDKAPDSVKEALLDTGYNTGPGLVFAPGVQAASAGWEWQKLGLALLSTATVDGRTVMGLAKRRAVAYNKIVDESAKKSNTMMSTKSVRIYNLQTVDNNKVPVYSGMNMPKTVADKLTDLFVNNPYKVSKIAYDPENQLVYMNKEGNPVHRMSQPRDLENSVTPEVDL